MNKGQFRVRKRTQKDYSLAFKLQVVDEVEKGVFNQAEAQRRYGIQGNATILAWLRKHGTLDWNSKSTMSSKATPNKRIRELEQRIKRLEAEKLILNTAIDVADDLYKTNIRKKFLPLVQQSSGNVKGEDSVTAGSEEQQPIANTLGYSRQAFYKRKHGCTSRESAPKALTRRLVDEQRKLMPRLGTRKLYYLITPQLQLAGIKCGRDKLFDWLREDGLLIKPPKRYIQTTHSKHHFRKYDNIARDMLVTAPEQLWVSDITYVRSTEGWMYLSLITDAFSRKIVDYSIADNMEAATVGNALRMALAGRIDKDACPVHHSDRGIQYCSKEYTELALSNGLILSMTLNGDPYENALAERMNRTLKDEFGLGLTLPDKKVAIPLAQQAIDLYNNRRPHLALGMKTPQQAHKKIPALEATGII